MLEVLPLNALREEDGPFVGSNLLNISKLAQIGFPIADGIVVVPPEFALKTVLSHLGLKDRDIFEQRLELIKSQVKNIPIPKVLEKELNKRRLDSQKLWHHLLASWIDELRSKIWRVGLSVGVTQGLTAYPVLFTGEISCYGKAYFDYEAKIVEVETQKGNLTDKLHKEVSDLVKSANKKLLLPFVYDWIIEGKQLKITKISSFTQVSEKEIDKKLDTARLEIDTKLSQSTIKVFLQLDDDVLSSQSVDGYFISSEKISNYETKLRRLLDATLLATKGHVFYTLSDTQDQFGGIKGTLKLLHAPQQLQKDVEAIKFARHKNGRLNCHLGIPYCRSVDEFVELKKQLMALGISRSGNLQYLLELSVPENYLNLEDYISVGFDTAVLELDTLAGLLGGFDPNHHESYYYKKQISSMVKFIAPTLKILHKHSIPFIAKGQLAMHDDVLSFLLENGIWGLVLESADASMIHQRLRILEQRIVKHRSKNTVQLNLDPTYS